jgi:AcrR family transcriptional regulator
VRRGRSGAPPGPRRADLRRAAIVDSAGDLFIRHGVERTTVDEIVEGAGVAKGTFYHYFRSKTDLLEALRVRFSTEFTGRVCAAVAEQDPGDWAGKLESWLTEAVHAYFEMRELHDVVFHGAEMPVRCAMGDVPIVQDLAGLLADGVQAGAWAECTPHATAVVMFHGLHGAADEAIVTGVGADEVAGLVRRLFVSMIGAR